jgi:hypothetical protein
MAYEDSTTGARGTHHPAEPYQRPCLDLDGDLSFHERVELVVRALRTCPDTARASRKLAEKSWRVGDERYGLSPAQFRAEAIPALRSLISIAVDVRRRGRPVTPTRDLIDNVLAHRGWRDEQ